MFKYCINFVDDFSNLTVVYFLKCKNDASLALEKFIADIAPFGKIKCLKSDNGGEFVSLIIVINQIISQKLLTKLLKVNIMINGRLLIINKLNL